MAYITYDDFPVLRERLKGKKIILTTGSFDLVHAGHAQYLEACKALGDILVVGVGRDRDIKRHKGDKRPILNEHVRMKMIDSLKPVDYAFLIDSPAPGAHLHSPLIGIYGALKPDSYVLNYDASGLDRHTEQCANSGIHFVVLNLDRNKPPEFEGISTTQIIERIKDIFS